MHILNVIAEEKADKSIKDNSPPKKLIIDIDILAHAIAPLKGIQHPPQERVNLTSALCNIINCCTASNSSSHLSSAKSAFKALSN